MHHLLIGVSSFLPRRDGQIDSDRIIHKHYLFLAFLASFVQFFDGRLPMLTAIVGKLCLIPRIFWLRSPLFSDMTSQRSRSRYQ